MKILLTVILFSISFASQSQTTQKADFFITGYEMIESKESQKIYDLKDLKWEHAEAQMKKYKEEPSQKASPVTSEENSSALRKTLESFQKAITGLCISHLELSLAFNVSAKAWMVVSGEIDGTVKVILKNPNQKCPK